MPRRGRPRKNTSIYSFRNLVEYSSDSESDTFRIRNNPIHEVLSRNVQRHERTRDRSPLQRRQDEPQVQQEEHQAMDVYEIDAQVEPLQVEDDHGNGQEQEQIEADDQQQQQQLEQHQQHQIETEDLQLAEEQLQPDHQQHRQQRLNDLFHDEFPDSSSDEEEGNDLNDNDDYGTILDNLKAQWVLAEIDHCVSKTASEAFWKLSLQYFPKLQILQSLHGKRKKNSSIQDHSPAHVRRSSTSSGP